MGEPMALSVAPTIVLAPDSFKESMSALEACEAMAAGVRAVFPAAECRMVPMADGGEGTVDAVLSAWGTAGHRISCHVQGALGDEVSAEFGNRPDKSLAVLEAAAAIGLDLLVPEQRDIARASSFGVGQLILAALDVGAQHLVVGLGGTSTNDGGAGMLTALGARLLDPNGQELPPGGLALSQLEQVELDLLDPRLDRVTITVAGDVNNRLLGPHGASHVFGPQKGANQRLASALDASLARFAEVVSASGYGDLAAVDGGGAAGGLGAALLGIVHAELRAGVDVVAEATGLAEALAGADLVMTGEGRVDGQTGSGKTPIGVARIARGLGVPVMAFAGSLGPGWEALADDFMSITPITDAAIPLGRALAEGRANLTAAVRRECEKL